MKKNKSKKNTEVKVELIKDIYEEGNQIKKLIIILLSVTAIVGILYFVTAKYIVKDKFQKEENTEIVISYDEIDVGNIFNRPYSSYYVLAYDSESTEAEYIKALKTNTKLTDTKIYIIDLSKEVNSQYLKDSFNKSAQNSNEISFGGSTLVLIQDAKIANVYEGKESIASILR